MSSLHILSFLTTKIEYEKKNIFENFSLQLNFEKRTRTSFSNVVFFHDNQYRIVCVRKK
jgi:hypothetical protein